MPYTFEQEIFLIECYFRNAQKQEDGQWSYSMIQCVRDFEKEFPEAESSYDTLSQHIRRLVKRFRETGTISKGKSSGRKTVLTEDMIEDIRFLIEQDPTKSLRQLSRQTGSPNSQKQSKNKLSFVGLSVATCHKVVKYRSKKIKKEPNDPLALE
ncbi:hypothetical protein BDFB_003367 [Asbolus verrucosus]|uniref:Uncharacterized protein n=1 Tax=Asbolus verrucosus TaxID=1661398 RepID=A0A482WE72_ASBVE|nr:hypothetical protein BDFB_003367 [Asbolus verrucosus]